METEKTPVKEKLKGFWEKFKAALGKVSKVVWIIVAILIVALVAGIIIYANTRPYSILITGANPDEVTTVTTWLDSRGVRDYRTRGSGTVLVPERQAVALKAALLGEMYAPDSKYARNDARQQSSLPADDPFGVRIHFESHAYIPPPGLIPSKDRAQIDRCLLSREMYCLVTSIPEWPSICDVVISGISAMVIRWPTDLLRE